ncbi:unnamed protein product [Rhizoctonia solani]|uniref:DUF2423 domain-containing protein n=1 Tax=Rhizoctonia solani TaxID=456999 RepID=A0A8H2X833_9AGAM|nr:unnamed protein product [Rhizoctonia solani]
MAKSTRSKSKRAFRRHKREDGVYAATDSARLQRLSAKLAAKISADKDGDQEMEKEEDSEQQVEGGGEHLPGSGYQFCGVDAREGQYGWRLGLGGVLLNVAGGEENLNNIELMSLVSFDGRMEEDGHMEMEELGHMASSSLVYDSDGDVEMVDFERELAHKMEEPCVVNPSYERTILWCLRQANVEAYEDMGDGSIGDETEFKLIASVQSSLDDPEQCWEDNPLFQYEYMDPLSEAVYVHAPPLEYFNSQWGDASKDGAKRVDYPSLFQGDFHYGSAC